MNRFHAAFLCVVVLGVGLLACTPEADHSAPDAPSVVCTSDDACDDGYFCNGVERCDPGGARADFFGCVAGASPCPDACDERRGCVSCGLADRDRDGENEIGCGGDDCDDRNSAVHPGAIERCDGADDDCDGRIDEELPDVLFLDRDGDGHGDPLTPLGACADDGTASMLGDDCDDLDASVHPGARDDCDGVDDDCDGRVDVGAICGALENYACEDGRCVVHTCPAGRADCNGVAADGCEAVLDEDVDHCGACDHSCRSPDGARACVEGLCEVAVCPAGQHPCGERCFDDEDPAHCGAECVACPPSPAHGASVCRYRCELACDDGFTPSYDPGGVAGCTYLDPRLTSLRVVGEALTPAFVPSVYAYVVALPLATESISLIVETPAGSDLTLTLDGRDIEPDVPTPALSVPAGLSRHAIEVAGFSGYPMTYVLWVIRGQATASRIDDPSTAATRTFGAELDVSGDRVAVSSRAADGTYELSVFRRGSGVWSVDGSVTLPATFDTAGSTIAIDGDWLAVGALGATVGGVSDAGVVLLYRRGPTGWDYDATLTAATATPLGHYGASLAMDGDLLVVGAPRDPTTAPEHEGAIYTYRLGEEGWALDARLESTSPGGLFGLVVAASGDIVVVGAEVLERRSTGWARLGQLARPDGWTYFANRVAISGDLIALTGELSEFPYREGRGVVGLFERVGDAYVHLRTFRAPNSRWYDGFANALALDGDLLVVGASSESGRPGLPFDETLPNAGAVFVFRQLRSPTPEVWYLKSSAVPPRAQANFGSSVAVDDGTVVVGARAPDAPRWLDVFALP